jgi:two-component system, OmpR family, KDP operon response regulator KdpE
MEPANQTGNGLKILVVDDDPAVLKVIRKSLEDVGYQVLEARDGKTALELLAHGPVMVLQDLILPDIAGYDLVAKLRARTQEKPISILALSGYLETPEAPWDTSAGFDGFLHKPFTPAKLVEAVKALLGQ